MVQEASLSRARAVFLAWLLLNAGFTPFVYASDSPSAAASAANPSVLTLDAPPLEQPSNLTLFFQGAAAKPPTPSAPSATPSAAQLPGTVSFSCTTSSLTPRETQALQELLRDGVVGEELSAGTPKDEHRDTLDANQLIVTSPDQDQNVGVVVKIPNKKLKPFDVSYLLNRYIDGSFGFGISVADSVRTGRCDNLASGCPVNGVNLQYRNSGAGIKADFKNVWTDFKGYLDANAQFRNLSPEEDETFRGYLSIEAESDANNFTYKTGERLKTQLMGNSILVDDFEARFQTNCMNSKCLINTYSMFDKYFNSWYSAQLVVGTAAPTFWGQARQLYAKGVRRGWLPVIEDLAIIKQIRKSRLLQPSSWVTKRRIKEALTRVTDAGYYDEFVRPLTTIDPKNPSNGFYLLKSEPFQNWWGQVRSKGGLASKITSIDDQRAIMDYVREVRKYTHSMNLLEMDSEAVWKKAMAQFGEKSPEAQLMRIEYGKQAARSAIEMDDILNLDWPAFWTLTNQNFSFKFYAVKDIGTGRFRPLMEEHRNWREILRKFEKDGHWGNWNPALTDNTSFATRGGNVLLYEPKEGGKLLGSFDKTHLHEAMAQQESGELFTRLDSGQMVALTHDNIPMIEKEVSGQVKVYRTHWAEIAGEEGLLTPEKMASEMLNTRATHFRQRLPPLNADQMYNDFLEMGFGGKHYTSVLSKALIEEENLLKTYFTWKGGFKWTALPFVYDWAKRGFGSEDASVYMLPDEWKDLMIYTGDKELYSDAYIDFFANEGSDQGDIFNQVLQKLPWKYVLNEVSQNFNPLNDLYNAITKQELRSETENLAFFLHTQQDCPGCLLSIQAGNMSAPMEQWEFSPFFYLNGRVNSYFLEDLVTQKAKDVGQTLIAFTHHTNLKGRSGDIDGGTIDLAEAKRKGETCDQIIAKNFMGLTNDNFFGGSRLGLALGGMETLSYMMFFWSGIFVSSVQQLVLAPILQDCVDDQEGYYVHYFTPAEKAKTDAKSENELSTEKVSKKLGDFKEKYLDALKGDNNSFTREAFDTVGDEVSEFVDKGMKYDVLQASLALETRSAGQLHGISLFNFWCAPGCEIIPSEYITQGHKVLESENSDAKLDIDFEKGKISYTDPEGKTKDIVTSEDHVRLEETNTKIPAEEIPQTLTKVTVPDNNKLLLEINPDGMAYVRINEVLDCIQNGVEEQTGLPLASNNLFDAFGRVKVVVSDSHPIIKPINDDGKPRIIAEGVPRKMAEGSDASIEIYTPAPGTKVLPVKLPKSSDGNPGLGNLKSVQFENGSITYKTTTGELLVYLKHHRLGVLEQNDVAGLKTTLEQVTNPDTGCTEPAIQFEVQGNPDSDRAKEAATNFNKSLGKLGPFQVFETEEHRYILYTDAQCKEHLKVINKKTGESQDFTGKAIATPDGLKFVTDDGQEHTLKFSEKDGVPQVQFDKEPVETLRAAQGRNGAFYYDPETGQWYAENGQLIPLLEAFKQNGFNVQGRDDGSATARAEGNILNVNLGDKETGGLLNLPGLPEQPLALAGFLLGLLLAFVFIRAARFEAA